MKKQTTVCVALLLCLVTLFVPGAWASSLSIGNSMINSDSEFFGDAVYNETIDIKWSTGTDTYEWKQSSLNSGLFEQQTHSVFDFRQDSGEISWSFQRSGAGTPSQPAISQYIDDHSIMQPQYRVSYKTLPFMPGIRLF